ncbi:MAG: helix-turn-helix transcriptional regulator [Bacteroidia bacterium]
MYRFELLRMEDLDATGTAATAHRHGYYTLIWVQAGQGDHLIDFERYLLAPDRVFLLHPEQMHLLRAQQPQGWVLKFSLDFLCATGVRDSFLEELGLFTAHDPQPPLDLGHDEAGLLGRWFDLLHQEQQERPFAADAAGALLKLILITCRRLRQPTTSPVATGLAAQFRAQVAQHYRRLHQVQDYAAQLHVTPNHLKEVVRQALGQSAKQLIQDRIMLEARRLAHFSDLTTKEVAFELGFADPAHFSKFFKNCAGLSFTDFRAGAQRLRQPGDA